MITEDYCSYEVSKLLKEKGFDGDGSDAECHMFYSNYTEENIMPIMEIGLVPYDEACFAPTHQMAMKWLRKNNIIVIPQPEYFSCDKCESWVIDIWADDNYERLPGNFPTYEQAVDAALKYSLENLI